VTGDLNTLNKQLQREDKLTTEMSGNIQAFTIPINIPITTSSVVTSFIRRVRNIAKKRPLASHVCPSIRMEQLDSHWTIFMKFDIGEFSENLSRNSSVIKIGQE